MTFPASIPLRREPESHADTPVMDVAWVGAFVLLCVALWGLWLQRRRGVTGSMQRSAPTGIRQHWMAALGVSTGAGLQLLSTTRLGPRHSLHEVDWQGRRLLVGCTDQTIQLLAEAPTDEAGIRADAAGTRRAPAATAETRVQEDCL